MYKIFYHKNSGLDHGSCPLYIFLLISCFSCGSVVREVFVLRRLNRRAKSIFILTHCDQVNRFMQFRRIIRGLVLACVMVASITVAFSFHERFREQLPQAFQDMFEEAENIFYAWLPGQTAEHVLDVFPPESVLPSSEKEEEPEDAVSEAELQEQDALDKDEDFSDFIMIENRRYTVNEDPDRGEMLQSEVLEGDTAGKILGDWLDPNSLAELLAVSQPVYALTKIRVGQAFSIIREPKTGVFQAFLYEIDKEKFLDVARNGEQFTAQIKEIDYVTKLVRVKGSITTSLSEAIVDMKEKIGLAISLADIFASEINFITDLRVGDSFDVLIEKRYRQDEFKGYGKLLAARFVNQDKEHTAYLFYNEQGKHTYYDRQGENLHRAILKAPLSFLRVTSQYSMARRHPVFGNVRPHQGIDYGAPKGTPIMAVGDGVVTQVGFAGGYGKQVILKHANGLESMYGHMSRFGKGIAVGKKVQQGQTIGYVGATGTATGPHLDFRIKRNGTFVNPAKLVVPRDKALERKRLKHFKAVVEAADAYWKDAIPDTYDPDTWFTDKGSR